MKEITGFQCEKCFTIYPEEVKAKNCEDSHITPEFVRYEWIKGKSIPESIAVKYERDGEIHTTDYF